MIPFIQLLIMMSLKTSVLIFIISIIKLLFKRFLTVKSNYYIWFLLIVSLVLPFGIHSEISIYNLIKLPVAIESANNPSDFLSQQKNLKLYMDTKKDLILETHEDKTALLKENGSDNGTNNPLFYLAQIKENNRTVNFMAQCFFYVWLTGLLMLSSIVFMRTKKFQKKIESENISLKSNIKSMFNTCKNQLKIKQEVELRTTRYLTTPSLIGLFHPIIFLPEKILNNFKEDELKYIVMHELAHVKKHDILIKWIILICQLVHWFNPIVWLGFSKMKKDMELDCDAYVLNNIEKDQYIHYGEIILNLLEYLSQGHAIPVSTNIIDKNSEIKRRIIMISKFNKKTYGLTLVSLIIILCIGYVAVAAAVPKSEKENLLPALKESVQELPEEETISASEAEQILQSKDDLLGKDYSYVWDLIGTPYIKTYYVNTKDTSKDDIAKNMSSVAVYPIKDSETNSALYIYFDKDCLVNVESDEFSEMSGSSWKDSDYTVTVRADLKGTEIDGEEFKNMDDETNIKELSEKYTGKSLIEFRNDFNLSHGCYKAISKNSMQLDIYPIVSKSSPSPYTGIYVYSEAGMIKSINTGMANLQFKNLDELFK